MLIIDKLRQSKELSRGEELIAEFIIQAGEEIKNYSARSIAKETYTSPATVLNLCKKIGVNGFNNFKEEYLKELEYINRNFGEIDANMPFQDGDTIPMIANKLGTLYEETIKDTLSLLRHDMVQKAVQIVKESAGIHVYSYGTALNLAESFKEKMMKIGKNVYITNNLNYQRYEINCLSQRDCVFFISYSGETRSIINMARTCIRFKIPFITITSYGENTLSNMGSVNLYISTRESLTHNIANFNSNLSINFLLDVLYSAYFAENYRTNYEYKLSVTKKSESRRSSTNPILQDNQQQEI